jgi:two-component SAPR family response regulator
LVAERYCLNLQVLFMTGYAENAAGHFFLEPGMETIIKPFSTELLATKISEMMESGRARKVNVKNN